MLRAWERARLGVGEPFAKNQGLALAFKLSQATGLDEFSFAEVLRALPVETYVRVGVSLLRGMQPSHPGAGEA